MARALSPLHFCLTVAGLVAFLISAAVTTPHNRYYRWQQLETTFTRKGDWIYERLHFDPSRIDVALIGTSRTGVGLSGPEIEAAYCAATGRSIYVANFGFAGVGRNLHYAIAKEAILAKQPSLVLIEINELETRRPHGSFVQIADAEDIMSAPLFLNLNWFEDLFRLPGRQVDLFAQTVFKTPRARTEFDPAQYQGRSDDRSREQLNLDGSTFTRFVRVPEKELDKLRRKRTNARSKFRLPESLEPLDYRLSRVYIRKIGNLAAKNGGSAEFDFLPAYKEPTMEKNMLRDLGIDPAEVIRLGDDYALDPGMWRDATHVNAWGAIEQSRRLGAAIAERHKRLGVEGC